MTYQWDFSSVFQAYPVLLRGLWNTLLLAFTAVAGSLLIGLLVGVARSTRGPISWAGAAYVEIFRNVPVPIQLFLFFYLVPLLFGIRNNAFIVSAVTLSLYKGAFIAEIYRSGIQSIERGQWDAARALGLGHIGQFRYVVLPQAIKRMIPAFTNRVIETFKLTTVASLIVYPELLYQTRIISESEFRPLESFTILAIFFAAVVMPISYLSARLEKRLAASD
ncbi:MAG TPA: amino acid ABC transporter permease [Beijerinckiaceae bacterium]|nr:amino acid ABC transporter permease [Beijerinckiaceae bacterium]